MLYMCVIMQMIITIAKIEYTHTYQEQPVIVVSYGYPIVESSELLNIYLCKEMEYYNLIMFCAIIIHFLERLLQIKAGLNYKQGVLISYT